jgi:hypothetical protein
VRTVSGVLEEACAGGRLNAVAADRKRKMRVKPAKRGFI